MRSSAYFVLAAAAAIVVVFVHGVIGHRVMMVPLRHERLFPTRVFGDADMSWRIFAVTWHLVTVAFASSAVAFILLATGRIQGVALPLLLSATHAAFLLVGVFFVIARSPRTLLRLIPMIFVTCNAVAAVAGWLGARSL